MSKKGRNELCPCGSGKKYKKCCGVQAQLQSQTRRELFKGGLGIQNEVVTKGLSDRIFKVMKNANEGIGHKMHNISTAKSDESCEKEQESGSSHHHSCECCD